MKVYVRVPAGGEDCYEPYQGHVDCGYPLKADDEQWAPKDNGCPHCGQGRYRYRYATGQVGGGYGCEIQWWPPQVIEGADGSLTIKYWDSTVGRYPSGGWLSWRSN